MPDEIIYDEEIIKRFFLNTKDYTDSVWQDRVGECRDRHVGHCQSVYWRNSREGVGCEDKMERDGPVAAEAFARGLQTPQKLEPDSSFYIIIHL